MHLKNNFSRFLGLFLMAEAGQEGAQGGGAGDPAAAAPAPASGSLLNQGQTTDFIPEKYRTNKEDGSLDLEASSRKMSEAYKHLETRMGSGDAPPKTVDEYAVKLEGVEGFDWNEFKSDENTQSFLKGAHAKGLTNDQVQFVIGEYLKAAPGLVTGGAVLDRDQCIATLKTAWGDEQTMNANLRSSFRAAEAFASEPGKPGNFEALNEKYGKDPDFIAFAANIGRELAEDTQINSGNAVSEGDFNVKAADLRQQLQTLPAHDPKRPGIQAQLDAMYESRYNKPAGRTLSNPRK
ncbi:MULTISPECIES: hypothetical protein [Pseudomonas syringae group]|uniref:hypothetical protein n=1 Tax=Pseudomonas syringae group TaxID=136849 RepID=UPI000EFE0DF9|nr:MULTISPECIES: hypothetical protein [Pseudomonas syringae group]MBI6848628.1 hypothetical protein [Pseudomonas syringae]RMV04219.1 hypothetical protein ALP19_01725 [Pseudomonas syringae pv. tomato]TES52361.1 hypothetical protein E2N91_29950 [Pseudomonas syringae pv. tomato]